MKCLVLGVGRMGTAIAYAMDKLGFHVIGMDTNPEAANNIPKKVNLEDGKTPRNEFFIVENAEDICRGIEAQEKPDVVISSLPYHQTEIVGKWCIDNGVRYCDLGGRVDVSESINNYAKEKATKPIMTDLGLAPGWVNIIAEQGYSQINGQVDKIEMMVGGLPCSFDACPPLNYACTWSIDGLINEYKDDCEVLIDGEIKTEQGMEGLEDVEMEILGKTLEAFYTSGGASHSIRTMKERGVKDCSYKTLRYKGHCDAVRFLIRHAKLSDEEMEKIFKKGCPPQPWRDVVMIKVKVLGGNLSFDKELIVPFKEEFSAMQRATAFPISSVASIMAEGHFDDLKTVAYKDIPFEKFNENLNSIGLSTLE